MDKYITLIGLGAVGAPLADLLNKEYGQDFALLSSENFLSSLENLYMNGNIFAPNIYTKKEQLKKKIGVVFICVKNYQIESVATLLQDLIDEETIIFPLQNGVYSFDYFSKKFPNNVVLEGFAQGPNTNVMNNIYVYQKPGMFHVGSSNIEWKSKAKYVVSLMKDASVNCFYNDDIKYEVWKKLMLNVAGNAITALTGIDYCMFENSPETQKLCRRVMSEFIEVANYKGIHLTENDIEEIINYYLSFKVSKHTSMLEDVTNKRPTENEYIAGFISQLALEYDIKVPSIDMLYYLIKIKEQVYLMEI
jgi:2-dehydropantoate 2-reductase